MADPRDHLHEQGRRRDAPPGRRPRRRPEAADDVDLDLPLGLRADPAARTSSASATARRSPSTTTATAAGSSSTSSTTSASTTKRFPPRAVLGAISQAKSDLLDAGRRTPPGRGHDLRGADRPGLRSSTSGASSRRTPWTSTTCSCATVRLFREHDEVLGRLPGALRPRARRRVPGHEPGPERARHPARRGAPQRLRRRRLRPEHLPLPGRRGAQPARLRARLPRGARRSCSTRTTAPPRRSSMPRTRSSATTWSATRRRCGAPSGAARRSAATGPATSATRRPSSPNEIATLRREQGVALGEIAVFYRTNAQSRALERRSPTAGLPYKVIGGTRFYDRREVRDLPRVPAPRRRTRATRSRCAAS